MAAKLPELCRLKKFVTLMEKMTGRMSVSIFDVLLTQ